MSDPPSAAEPSVQCPGCGAPTPDSARFCAQCGVPLPASDAVTTTATPNELPHVGPPPTRLARRGHAPGTVLADRFRIIGLLGRGGMGEVYRADDLRLGQPVALKFLPADVADRPARRDRFLAEVRIARQVSHPNVCRVYDIGEIDGHLFLSMEFIDGEDLSSLIKRIGHLPARKVLESMVRIGGLRPSQPNVSYQPWPDAVPRTAYPIFTQRRIASVAT